MLTRAASKLGQGLPGQPRHNAGHHSPEVVGVVVMALLERVVALHTQSVAVGGDEVSAVVADMLFTAVSR